MTAPRTDPQAASVPGRTPEALVLLDAAAPESGVCPPSVWRVVTDRVMGGLSDGAVSTRTVQGRPAVCLEGAVRLENDGGFIQMACDLQPGGGTLDASAYATLDLDVCGDGAAYGVHLRTTDLVRPWQSYRLGFVAPDTWTTITLPLAAARPHRTDAPFRPSHLRRLGLVAIGRAFRPSLVVGRIVLRASAADAPP